MAENVTQSELEELDAVSAEKNIKIQWADGNILYEGTFKGNLLGTATTAKQLEKAYRFTLSGDASGSVEMNAADAVMSVSVNKAKYAEECDFSGKASLATRATYADLANTAEFAYHAGTLTALFINLSGLLTGKGEARNANTIDVNVTDIDLSYTFVFSALPTKPDTKKVYVDIKGKGFWIYDIKEKVWRNCFQQLVTDIKNNNIRISQIENLDPANRLNSLENRTDAVEANIATNVTNISALGVRTNSLESRTTTLEKRADATDTTISQHAEQLVSQSEEMHDHEKRLNSVETTSDVGKFSVRMLDVETKNNEQDERLSAVEYNKLVITISSSVPDVETMANNTGVMYPSTNLL